MDGDEGRRGVWDAGDDAEVGLEGQERGCEGDRPRRERVALDAPPREDRRTEHHEAGDERDGTMKPLGVDLGRGVARRLRRAGVEHGNQRAGTHRERLAAGHPTPDRHRVHPEAHQQYRAHERERHEIAEEPGRPPPAGRGVRGFVGHSSAGTRSATLTFSKARAYRGYRGGGNRNRYPSADPSSPMHAGPGPWGERRPRQRVHTARRSVRDRRSAGTTQ